MRRNILDTLILGSMLGTVGCATSFEQCDPNKESFLGTANCMMSSEYGYNAREQRLENELAEQQEINRGFKELATSIEVEKQRIYGQLSGKQADYTELNRSWESLQGRLQQRSVENQALAAQIERMEEKMAVINNSRDKSVAEKEKLLNDLRRQAVILNQELEAGLY